MTSLPGLTFRFYFAFTFCDFFARLPLRFGFTTYVLMFLPVGRVISHPSVLELTEVVGLVTLLVDGEHCGTAYGFDARRTHVTVRTTVQVQVVTETYKWKGNQ